MRFPSQKVAKGDWKAAKAKSLAKFAYIREQIDRKHYEEAHKVLSYSCGFCHAAGRGRDNGCTRGRRECRAFALCGGETFYALHDALHREIGFFLYSSTTREEARASLPKLCDRKIRYIEKVKV